MTELIACGVATKKKPQQVRSRNKVERILGATCRLLAKNCFSTLTTNHIAKESGVTVGSIYQFFPGKNAIIYELATIWFNDINEKTNRFIKARVEANEDAGTLMRELFCYVALEYKSPVFGAEKELTRALYSNPELTSLDQRNKQLQSTVLQSVFQNYRSPRDDESLLDFCHFMHEIILTCSYQVAFSEGKKKEKLLEWSLALMDSMTASAMREA